MKHPPKYTGRNAEIIENYTEHLNLKGRKESTINTKLWKIYTFLINNDDIDLNTVVKEDIEKYLLERRKDKSERTYENDIKELRPFFNWLKPENSFFENIEVPPKRKTVPTNNPLDPKDIKKLLAACKTQRDRTIIAILYDSAARIEELIRLNVGDVVFDQYGAAITVNGKTGERRIRLINAEPEIKLWLNQHPYRDNPDKPLFVVERKTNGEFQRISIRRIQNMLKDRANNAGVNKRVNPHSFRHGRLTEMAKRGLGEMDMRVFAGWERSSKMPEIYLHISGKDVDDKILSIHGIETDTKKPEENKTLTPIECPRCHNKNPCDAKYCSHCSLVLDDLTAMDLEQYEGKMSELLVQFMQNEEARKIFEDLQKKD
ncbi:site-specific integrase [Methanococcoides sp. AM1]|uniref:site-specific integrase n=1 Tax=Methanococcoides sp. AM1 TaxID=1201011 RepID=UPI0014385C48|nr:site-specific integrase [Methanococcoides sp. AM1]